MDAGFSACVEMLFLDAADDCAGRIRAAHAAGFAAVEFWHWRNKDLIAVEAALAETGLALSGMLAEPVVWLTDRDQHQLFLDGLGESLAVARRLGAGSLIVQAGGFLWDRPRQQQREALVDVLRRAAAMAAGTGVALALEPLNTRVDHPGYFLDSTTEGLDVVDAVGRSELGLLFDIYHSAAMDEDMIDVLAGRVDRLRHVHLADHPGRHEPGTGRLAWAARLAWLKQQGYAGRVGLEYLPSVATRDSLAALQSGI